MGNRLWIVLSVVGCVPPTSQPTYFGSQQQGYGQAPPAPGYEGAPAATENGGANCIAVFQCLAACTEQSCYQPCYERGTPEAQQAAAAVISCGQTGAACETEFATCRNQGGYVATQPTPTAPASSTVVTAPSGKRAPVSNDQILGWLTGSWIGNNHQFEFYGDGRVRRSGGGLMSEKRPGEKARDCVAVINDVGTVTQQGDYLIMEFAATDGYTCGTREHTPGVTIRYQIEWVDSGVYYDLDELQLVLRDIDCTNGDMWCTDRVRRR
ncbi:MAG: hypothetical protein ACKV2T_38030 [Kofleriaceae bacterium]